MMFDYPWVLTGIAVIIPLLVLNFFFARGKRILKIFPKNLQVKLIVSRLCFGVFLVCLIIALAGPRWGMGRTAGEYRRALDAVIAIDISRSMDLPDGLNDDINGATRLERGVSIVREAVTAFPGMRFAVAVSRNQGVITIPLTWDNDTVLTFLDILDGSSLTGWGTNLESLVDAAASAFQPSYPSSRVILLVSDGEALSGSLNSALRRCSQNSIAITAIAVGSEEGMTLPGYSDIISRRETDTMRMAARETGGAFIDGNRDNAGQALITHLRSLASEAQTGEGRLERKARWFLFAILAIIAFGVSKASLVL